MSEAYEGVVFNGPEPTARSAFAALDTPLRFRLLRLSRDAWGLGRVASRTDRFDPAIVEQVGAQVSRDVGAAVAVFYDNSCGLRSSVIFRAGLLESRIGEADEVWVPLDDSGQPCADAPGLRVADLKADHEYECLTSAIELGLRRAGVKAVSESVLKAAFCYDEAECVAES